MKRAVASKPDTATAMRALIAEIRRTLPFDEPGAHLCTDECRGCSVKLLDYLQSEVESWETRLDAGETPGLADLSTLAKKGRKIFKTLQANGVI